ncbi:fibronectin type III domain-containing protein [Vallitalea guaymasensis]|uniref:Fibronectin type III domain-containing protein n=1 Tax=Vallitalea guaymasensis TaxID=1185412 RepID=A0A8J8MBS0_9FIRM|nr:fibronectin type III domain-containing protein [Vallitalea guaymasensis]QUH29780.1 fibronectin type III domain-containing protein [Vallitalea guaymasensis]
MKTIYKINVYFSIGVLLFVCLTSFSLAQHTMKNVKAVENEYVVNDDGSISIVNDKKNKRIDDERLKNPKVYDKNIQSNSVELVNKRDFYSKHYMNEDGTITATIGSGPIHYKNGDNYEDIDVSIKSRIVDKKMNMPLNNGNSNLFNKFFNKGDSLLNDINNEFEYSSEKNTFKSYFNSVYDLNNSRLAKFEITNSEGKVRSIIYSLDNAQPKSEVINNNKIKYIDIYENVDLEYIIDSAKLKENIIVKAPVKSFEFSFTLDLQGANAIKTDDGGIDFIDVETGEKLWEIIPPVAFDSSDEEKTSYDLEYTLKSEVKDNIEITKVILTVNDMEFLKNATYPIIIDPSTSVNRSHGRSICSSGFAQDDSVYGYAFPGFPNGVGSDEYIVYLNFNLSSIPMNSIVSDAKLTIVPQAEMGSGSGSFVVSRLTSSFSNATWQNQPSKTSSYQSSLYTSGDGPKIWNLTNMMNDIFNNNYTFYGIEIKASPPHGHSFYYDESNLPTLSVTYSVNHTPTLNITSPTNLSLFSENDTSISPTVSVYDADNNVLTCKVYIDSESTPRSTTNIYNTSSSPSTTLPHINMASLSEGTHQLKITVNDGYSTVEETLTIKVDKSAPIITSHIITPLTNQLNINVIATDLMAGLHAYPYRYTVNGIQGTWTTSNTYSKTGLTPGTAYNVKVEVRDALEHISNYIEDTYTLPEIPSLSISNATDTTLHLTIIDNNPADTLYEITDGVKFVNINGELIDTSVACIPFPDKQVTVIGLTPDTQYTFTIRAYKEEWSETSDGVTGTTSGTVPDTPENISTNEVSNQIEINWDSVENVTGYEVKMIDSELDEVIVETGMNTTYTHKKLEPESTYKYSVRARNTAGYSPWSSEITVTTSITEYILDCEIDETYDILLKAIDNTSLSGKVYTLTYNPDELEVDDLYIMTWEKEKMIGEIPGTISYVIGNPIQAGKRWTGLLNGIRFKSKINGSTTISITIQ